MVNDFWNSAATGTCALQTPFFSTKRYTEFLGCTLLAPVAPARSHRRSCIGDVHTTHSTTVPTVTPTMLSSSAKSFCTPKRLHHVKLKGLPKINTTCCADAVKTHKFNASIKNFGPARLEETAQSRWNQLTSFIHQPPVDAFGRMGRQNTDWCDTNLKVIEPATTAASLYEMEAGPKCQEPKCPQEN